MAKTLSTLVAGLGVGLFPALSFGLGLGDIQIDSRLNQRLHARIEVVDVSDEEWQQIRARIAPRTLLSEAAVHPEILESLNLRAIEDANHRHLIEVTSMNVLTEPLFDLPVAVAGSSLQVVRNYSVLLDPATVEDAPLSSSPSMLARQAVPALGAQNVGSSDAAGDRPAPVARVDAQAHAGGQKRVTRHHRSHLARRHSGSPHNVAAATNQHEAALKSAPPVQGAAFQTAGVQAAAAQVTPPAKGAAQQLEGQLSTLQQMLTQMQATIAAQDAQIAKLTAQVAARSESQVARQASAVAASVNEPEVSDEGASEVHPRWFHSHPLFYRLAGIVGGMVVLVLGVGALIRRRHSGSLRDAHTRDSSRKDSPSAEPRSDVLAWQSSLREAQSGTWRAPVRLVDPTVRDEGTIQVEETHAGADLSSEPASPPVTTADPEVTTVATTVAIEELTANLESDFEALSASYENEHLQTSTGVIDEWRAQKEMLERDYLSDTEALPFVLDEGNQAKSIETAQNPLLALQTSVDEPTEEQPIPTKGGAGQDTTVADMDVQLRLLEIYHKEALGNRDNFDALLSKLAGAQQHLSPAQMLHLETLQRSLREGKPDTDSDFVADVAM